MNTHPEIFLLSENCLLLTWHQTPSLALISIIQHYNDHICTKFHGKIVETVPANNSLAILFNPEIISFSELQNIVNSINYAELSVHVISTKIWEIPILYSNPDEEDVSQISMKTGLKYPEILNEHLNSQFWVNMIGFLPGFLYLSGLSEKLQVPRKSSPSEKIGKGAVAIAGTQSGIYPQDSPGGWYVIGRTPTPMFDPRTNPPVFANVGDQIQFVSINQNRFEEIENSIRNHGLMWQENDGIVKLSWEIL